MIGQKNNWQLSGLGVCIVLLGGCNAPSQPTASPAPTVSVSPTAQAPDRTGSAAIASPSPSASPTAPTPTVSPSATGSPAIATKPDNVLTIEQQVSGLVSNATQLSIQTVTCPAEMEDKVGKTYECQVSSEVGPFVVMIRPTGQPGKFAWGTRGLLLVDRLNGFIQKSVQNQGTGTVTVDCGAKARTAKQGDKFDCKVTDAQGKVRTARITVRDDVGNVYVALL